MRHFFFFFFLSCVLLSRQIIILTRYYFIRETEREYFFISYYANITYTDFYFPPQICPHNTHRGDRVSYHLKPGGVSFCLVLFNFFIIIFFFYILRAPIILSIPNSLRNLLYTNYTKKKIHRSVSSNIPGRTEFDKIIKMFSRSTFFYIFYHLDSYVISNISQNIPSRILSYCYCLHGRLYL